VANQKSQVFGEEVASTGGRHNSDTSCSHEDNSIEDVLKEAKRIEANGEHIVPSMLAENLELKLNFVCKSLMKLGYTQLKEIDPVTHMCIWAKTGNGSNTDDAAKAEAV
jgi:hypothetical protein